MRFCWILLYIFRTMYRYLLLLFITLLFNPVKGQEVSHVHSVHHTFIENKGQWEDHVFFKNKFDGGRMCVEQGRVLFQMQDYSMLHETHFYDYKSGEVLTYSEKLVELKVLKALEVRDVEKVGATEHHYSYFIGNDET